MVDVVLTRTQRKTPTVIHPGYKISRIRSFYMRKVKFTQQTIDEKLGAILQDFPRLDDIHPFYADLMNVLYDRDHFKLALAQVNTAKNLVQGISKDYLRMMKYGDSLYRCKQLKRAALGRMCTVLMKLKASLGYLEEVRKHISRLPALDPNTRTLLLTGYPNVGKSSFMNKVTRADVDVQAYAFTTKALYVGHMDHRFLRWQVIDTPGILDRPLEERNTIEMQAITALAHLQCCVLYFVDISEECGYTIDAQLALFNSIRPLFANKQVVLVANKTDVIPYDKLSANTKAAIESCAKEAGAELITMSNVNEEGVSALKTRACDKLLEARVEAKLSTGRVKDDVMSRITVAQPKKRDGKTRGSFIPDSVSGAMTVEGTGTGRVTEKQLMINNGGAGVYSCDYRKYYLLEEDEWKGDTIPEFMDGKNILEFFSTDIEERLKALDEEEASLEAQGAYADSDDDGENIDEEEQILYKTIKEREETGRQMSRLNKSQAPRSQTLRSRTDAEMKESLEFKGYNKQADRVVASMTRGRKRTRGGGDEDDDEGNDMDEEEDEEGGEEKGRRASSTSRGRSTSRAKGAEGRARSRTPGRRNEMSVPASKRRQVEKDDRVLDRKMFGKAARGPADREHFPKKVKHMLSGKRPGYGTKTIGR